ncbi:MAG: pitrilysin family protein [Chloroflexi bacterium]|nr:pitrilysin family protein [Chloroflexota bacterium]
MTNGDHAAAFGYEVPVDYRRLDNGLRVVLSPERSAPVVTVGVYYEVGFRLEPRGRTGFAHLFEHLMFQGSEHLEKMELVRLIQQNGGMLNGSTRTDFTNYFEVLPTAALELALWLEADRMRGPVITQEALDNQRDVVKNEVRVNVLNRPYGGFPWLDISERAFSNWHNAHNGYGEFSDLDAANLDDVRRFFEAYYSPQNAVLVVVGNIEVEPTFELVRREFEGIAGPVPPPAPDLSEPTLTEERRFAKRDPLATRPALAFAYHTPQRATPAFAALGVLDQLLGQGDDALLHRELVHRRGYSSGVGTGMNFLGNMHNARTPLLWTCSLVHDTDVTSEEILAAADTVIEPLREEPVSEAQFELALVKARSGLYDTLASSHFPGLGRLDLLASFALFDDDPGRINRLDAEQRALTPELLQQIAHEYLDPARRTVIALEPGGSSA